MRYGPFFYELLVSLMFILVVGAFTAFLMYIFFTISQMVFLLAEDRAISSILGGPPWLIALLALIPVIRRLAYLRDYPAFLKKNHRIMMTRPHTLDSEFQKRFVKISFKEIFVYSFISAVILTLWSGNSIVNSILLYIFFLFAEFFVFLSYISLMAFECQYAIPRLVSRYMRLRELLG